MIDTNSSPSEAQSDRVVPIGAAVKLPQAPSAGPTSRPFFLNRINLKSHQAQQIYKRQFTIVSTRLYQLSVILKILASESGAAAVEAVVEKEFADLLNEIETEKDRLRRLCEDRGIDPNGEINWTNPLDVQAEISSPRAARFLAVIRKVDEVVHLISILWLMAVIDDKQYTQGAYKWQRRVIRSGNRVEMVCNRAVGAARRLARESGGIAKLQEQRARTAKVAESKEAQTKSGAAIIAEAQAALDAPAPTLKPAEMADAEAILAHDDDDESARDAKFTESFSQQLSQQLSDQPKPDAETAEQASRKTATKRSSGKKKD